MLKAERYEEGKNVKVFYDLKDPNESILEHGLKKFTFIIMFILAISLFFLRWIGISGMIRAILADI